MHTQLLHAYTMLDVGVVDVVLASSSHVEAAANLLVVSICLSIDIGPSAYRGDR
jgi:hypothetical protein